MRMSRESDEPACEAPTGTLAVAMARPQDGHESAASDISEPHALQNMQDLSSSRR